VIERVLHNDTLVCGNYNKRAFDKLRQLLMMHYSVRDKAMVALGEAETMKIMGEIVERLSKRFGDTRPPAAEESPQGGPCKPHRRVGPEIFQPPAEEEAHPGARGLDIPKEGVAGTNAASPAEPPQGRIPESH
jgi:hypothetical protein